jgi:hypothetical protein
MLRRRHIHRVSVLHICAAMWPTEFSVMFSSFSHVAPGFLVAENISYVRIGTWWYVTSFMLLTYYVLDVTNVLRRAMCKGIKQNNPGPTVVAHRSVGNTIKCKRKLNAKSDRFCYGEGILAVY